MDWTQLLGQVVQTIYNNPSTPHQPGNDPGNLVGNLTEMFAQQQRQGNQPNGEFMNQVQQEIYNNPSTPQQPGNDVGGLIGQIANVFMQQGGGVGPMGARPASMDPMGDPAEMRGGGGGMRPASQDPYGDPADQGY